jgi:hypothetical protein
MLPNFSVPDRVEQMGVRAHRCGVSRMDNPYTDLADPLLAPRSATAAGMLEDAWWRGWDRAASEVSRAERDLDNETSGTVTPSSGSFARHPVRGPELPPSERRASQFDRRT